MQGYTQMTVFVPNKEVEFFKKILQKFNFKLDKKLDNKATIGDKFQTNRLTKLEKMFDDGVPSEFVLRGDELKEARYKKYAK